MKKSMATYLVLLLAFAYPVRGQETLAARQATQATRAAMGLGIFSLGAVALGASCFYESQTPWGQRALFTNYPKLASFFINGYPLWLTLGALSGIGALCCYGWRQRRGEQRALEEMPLPQEPNDTTQRLQSRFAGAIETNSHNILNIELPRWGWRWKIDQLIYQGDCPLLAKGRKCSPLLYAALQKETTRETINALTRALKNDQLLTSEEMGQILSPPNDLTPLMAAAHMGNVEVVEALWSKEQKWNNLRASGYAQKQLNGINTQLTEIENHIKAAREAEDRLKSLNDEKESQKGALDLHQSKLNDINAQLEEAKKRPQEAQQAGESLPSLQTKKVHRQEFLASRQSRLSEINTQLAEIESRIKAAHYAGKSIQSLQAKKISHEASRTRYEAILEILRKSEQ